MSLSKQSHRVVRGGVFHLPTAQYSNETRELLKAMMEECQLSMLKRRELNQFISGGEPFPSLQQRSSKVPPRTSVKLPPPILTRRRSLECIVQSGAYQRDLIKPTVTGMDSHKEKLRLQQIMTHGTVAPQNSDGVETKSVIPVRPQRDRFEELANEVRDRYQFLSDVAELGQEKRYRSQIEVEIAAKLRAMHAIDPRRSEIFRRQLPMHQLTTSRALLHGNPISLR